MDIKTRLCHFFKILFALSILALAITGCSDKNKSTQGYIEGRYTYISSSASGSLDQLFVKRGDVVKSGQPLFILDQQPESSDLEAANQRLAQEQQTLQNLQKGGRSTIIDSIVAQREQAAANLVFAEQTLKRYQKLYKSGAIARSDVDQAEATYKNYLKKVSEINSNLAEAKLGARTNEIMAQQAIVETAKANVAKANWALSQKTQVAPKDSTVFDTLFTVGEKVSQGDPVVSLLVPSDVYLVFFVPENLLSQIKLGENVSFKCDSCNKPYTAKIDFISPEAEYTPPVIYSEMSREKLVYRVEAILDTNVSETLHPGQPVDITIKIGQKE